MRVLLVFLLLCMTASVRGNPPKPAAEADDSLARPPRPVLLTTDEMLERAKKHASADRQPFRSAWEQTLARANRVLKEDLEPYQGTEYLRYFETARAQAQFARDLAIVYHVTGDERYAARSEEILVAWAEEFHRTSAFPEHYPASDERHGAGLVIGRTVAIFGDAYALLHNRLAEESRTTIREWFRLLVPPIQEELRIWHSGRVHSFEPPYLDRQYFNNHLSGCVLGIAAIGFALQDGALVAYAYQGGDENAPEKDIAARNPRDLATLITGAILMPGDFGSGDETDVWQGPPGDPSLHGAPPPLAGEVWDRYRTIQGHGIHYTLFHLRLLTLMAEMAHNNLGAAWYSGPDFYAFTGRRGENLEISYDRYADWFITMDPSSVNDGYYVDWVREGAPTPTVEGNMDALATYELAHFRYPGNERIRQALAARQEAGNRLFFDPETFAWTALLIYGKALD